MKLFQKNKIGFAVLLIVIYVVGVGTAQRISGQIGTEFLAELLFCAALSAVLFAFIRKNGLSAWLGLQKPEVSAAKMLYYVPLLLIACTPAFFGTGAEFGLSASILRTCMMLCVGFLEEVIFRGFLFRGIAEQNLTRAVVISSLTFGIGHAVNLLNGSELRETILQVIYAVVVGFLLVFLFLRTSSILPCIAFHALNNSMTAFASGGRLIDRIGEANAEIVMLGIQILIAGAYLLYTAKLPVGRADSR